MARPRKLQVCLVRCPCGLYQAAPMWRQRGAWWLDCLTCGRTMWKVSADHHTTTRPAQRLLKAA